MISAERSWTMKIKKSTFFKDFKAFATKGNVLDLAVAVIIGAAFGKIITSLVADMLMPLVGLIGGGVSIADLKWVITPAEIDAVTGAVIKAEAALRYGNFIQTIIDFLIIALSIFTLLRVIMKTKEAAEKAATLLKNKKEEEVPEVTQPEVVAVVEQKVIAEETPVVQDNDKVTDLLTEIRDLLKK